MDHRLSPCELKIKALYHVCDRPNLNVRVKEAMLIGLVVSLSSDHVFAVAEQWQIPQKSSTRFDRVSASP